MSDSDTGGERSSSVVNRSDPDRSLGRRHFIGAVSTTLPVVLAGCAGSSDSGGRDVARASTGGRPKKGGTLLWGGSVPVQGLDPHLDSAAASQRVLENITEGLVRLRPDYSLAPHLAKSVNRSDDNLTLRFDLRRNVTFHDGTAMTAADVLASFERVASGEYLASGFFEFVESMRTPDEHTFVVRLKEPFAPLLARMATSELHVLTEKQAKEDTITTPIGTGPFEFESREIESEFVMTRNEDYWREGVPHLDRVVKKEIPDSSIRLQSFRAGEFDFINGVPPKDVESVKGESGVRFEKQFPKSLVYLGMNCERKPFDDKHARLALDYAIDKEAAMRGALYTTGKTTASPAAPGSPWVNPNVEPREKDVEMAKTHLEKAGYPDGYSVSFKIPQSYPAQVTAAKVIADSASDAGIDLNIQLITWSTWLSQVYSKQDFEATTSSYLALYYPDVSFYKFLHPKGAFFFTGWTNERYNELVEKARHVYDEKTRKEHYYEATEILHEERAGHLFLFWQSNLFAAWDYYKGPIGAPDGSTLQFMDNWLA